MNAPSTSRENNEKQTLKHRIACQKSRRTKTLFRKAGELNKTNVEVFLLVRDFKDDILYWGTPGQMVEKFEKGLPLHDIGTSGKGRAFRVEPKTFGIDPRVLKPVKTPSPRKRKGKVSSVVGNFHLTGTESVVVLEPGQEVL